MTPPYDAGTMRIKLCDVTQNLVEAIREAKAGNHVVLMEDGTPIAMIECLWPASDEQERAIREMIESGLLRSSQKSGVRIWKSKSNQRPAA